MTLPTGCGQAVPSAVRPCVSPSSTIPGGVGRRAAPAWPVQLPASVEEAAAELAVSAAPVELRPKASAGARLDRGISEGALRAAAGMTLPECRRLCAAIWRSAARRLRRSLVPRLGCESDLT